MRWVVLAALVAGLACTKPDPRPEAIAATRTTFTKAGPVVGAKHRESSELAMTVGMIVDGGRANVSVREAVNRTEEILAVSGDAITKTKVTFDSLESTQPSAIAGKVFVVERKDGKLEVHDADGKAVSPAEAKEVEKHLKNLGKPDPMLAALPAAGVAPGERVDGVARVISDQLRDSGDGMVPSDVAVTFKEQRGDDGVFDVALELTKDEGATKMVISVKGAAWVSTKTSSTTKMELAGPVTIRGGQRTKSEGSGTMTMKMESKGL